MNNEEKILAMLELLTEKVDVIETDLKDVKGRQASFDNELGVVRIRLDVIDDNVKNIKGRLNNVEREVVKTNLTIENEIAKGIRLIAEGQNKEINSK